MQTSQLAFYFFSIILIVAASRVITSKNPVHAAMFLVLAFFTAACLWITLGAEFLAIALVLVYVGAVMVLFIFVVMMLDINREKERRRYRNWLLPVLIIAGVMVAEMFFVLGEQNLGIDSTPYPIFNDPNYSNTKELGRLIYTEYVYAFEIAAVILLVAIVAAIALTLRVRNNKRANDVADQVSTSSTGRIRMLSDLNDDIDANKRKDL